ncbi:8-oxo-dGTP diphosphatase [Stackebrandtia albiflava]|uniref:8-oxo-dGTP diphosphatase n=1 Tax=Stackebrandtia albiflava TaxID=406432 RepID=A0A562VBC1_9ACTN|nr:NUDIX domain-containing protein [Stackebrandtia albiflava]TWJ15117.1 8-oxo-dGTP diphosphatase [Stackebrandtia albiflava]
MSHDHTAPPTASVAVDTVILTVPADELVVLLVRRANPPYQGEWALPGGFLEADEDLDDAAARELREETGLRPGEVHLEQFRGYGAPGRDPRGRVVSIAYLALVPSPPTATAGGDAADVGWLPVAEVLAGGTGTAFDHRTIVEDAVEHARRMLEHTTVAAAFCPPEFTISQLRRVYEIVWGETLDPGNFHRKVTRIPDFLVATGESTTRDGGRPAALFRRGTATRLQPPLYRAVDRSASARGQRRSTGR